MPLGAINYKQRKSAKTPVWEKIRESIKQRIKDRQSKEGFSFGNKLYAVQEGEAATQQYEYEYVYEYEDVEDASKKVLAPAPVFRDQPPGKA